MAWGHGIAWGMAWDMAWSMAWDMVWGTACDLRWVQEVESLMEG